MKYELEELEQRIHTPQLEGIGERLEDDCLRDAAAGGNLFPDLSSCEDSGIHCR